ncbi:hypothetical protein E2P71_07895 [Candidatus Bathyarchaeota archaeon]|nr:hypothetical protein E2P71_07895 [Candidatus Bathyarchaeota archaeon]
MTGETRLETDATKLSKYFSSSILGAPHGYSMFLCGLDFAYGPSAEVVLTGKGVVLDGIISQLDSDYLPNTLIHVWSSELAEAIQYLEQMKQTESPMIYVCRNFACSLPTSKMDEALSLIKKG